MRPALPTLAGALVLLCFAASPATAAIHLTETGAKFPERSYVMTLDSPVKLTPGDVQVTENGESVDRLTVVPGDEASGTRFGTVLAIDTSDSMHDSAIQSAMGAARAFAARRTPSQPLGLVFFNGQTSVALPMTTDSAKITEALSTTPVLAPGTHIYDGVSSAMQMLTKAGVSAGSVIVLSDGTDTGSVAGERAVVSAAGANHTRIFAVGFRTRAYSPSTLKALSAAAKGQFAEAGSKAGVAALYSRLGSELSNQYVVRYRSTEPLGSNVLVAAKVAGVGRARTSYFAPALPRAAAGTGGKDGFLQTKTAEFLIVGLCMLLIAFAIMVTLAPRASVRSRVGQFVAIPEKEDKAWSGALLERTFGDGRRRRRERGERSTAFAEDLDLARIAMTPTQVILWTLAGTIFAAWFFATTIGIGGVLFALAVPFGVMVAIRIQVDRQRKTFDEQLPDNLQVIASAMRAGHTFLGAIGVVVEDAPEPSRRELRRVLADEQLGTPLGEALAAAAARMRSRDFEHVALVATLQRESGGNTAEVVDRVTESIRERLDLRRLVSTLTAQGRLAGIVVASLPVVLIFIISAINPGYLHPMFHTGVGIFLLIMAAIMLALGAWIIKRIVDIDV